MVDIIPSTIELYPGGPTDNFIICILGKSPGHLEVTTNVTTSNEQIKWDHNEVKETIFLK